MSHISVMPHEVLTMLDIQPSDVVYDGTLGGAGHALLMAEQLDPACGRLVCSDLDQQAIDDASVSLSAQYERGLAIQMYHGSFADISVDPDYLDISFDKILLDLGWSSNQFENALRGFSFMNEGPLDMRLTFPGTGVTAHQLLHTMSEQEIIELLEVFGEESRAKKIAAVIVHERVHGTLETTRDLARIIELAVGRHGKTHPATQTFQALRIAVNHEIEAITTGIPRLFGKLSAGGRMCIISFHSIEDRIIKQIFAGLVKGGNAKLVNKHVVTPSQPELKSNPRSRSAKIRTIERML
jgi:16S rRNA (cytosine1402-N4)-methyltransferase